MPKRNSAVLAKPITKVLNLSETRLAKISQAAAIRAEKEFSVEKQKQEFLEFYQSNFK